MNFAGNSPANAVKYSEADERFGVDWYFSADPPYLQLNESITNSVWTCPNNDGQLELYNGVFTETGTAIGIRGGRPGHIYTIINVITTDANNTGVSSFSLYIQPIE